MKLLNTLLNTFFILFLMSTSVTFADVSITAAGGGIDIVRSTAVNGSAPAYTTLGDIVILEVLVADIRQSQTNATLILTAPTNWQFNSSAGSVSTTLGDDITAISMVVAASTITVTLTTVNGNQGMNSIDEITITGIQVQPIDGAITPAAGDILRTSASPGTAAIIGITDDVTIFGSLSTDPGSPMPVELTFFSADLSGSEVFLNWETATEVNNYGFEVQRSVSADEWEILGFVEGHGNSNSPKEYEFIDDLSTLADYSPADSLEYRLKQIDLDGTYEYYGTTAKVELRNVTDVDDEALPAKFELSQNYPNPFNPVTRIQFDLKEQGNVVLTVYSVLGEQINVLVDESLQIGLHEVKFSGNNLPSGVYYYQLQFQSQESGTGYSEIKKMMLLK